MNLLIDIGNTRLKWVLLIKGEVSHSVALHHQPTNFTQQLISDWQSLPTPKIVCLSCVSSEHIKTKVINLVQQLWKTIKIIIAKSSAEAFGVKNSYLHPQKLGIDRWLGLIASYHHYQQAVWIADCGTAITLDFIDDQGQHGGGLIAPGLQLMKRSLLTDTAALDFFENDYSLSLANQTDNAIFSGTLGAATGLIEQFVTRKSCKALLILTGGDAKIIAENLSVPVIMEADLVLKGLAILMQKYL